MTDKTYKLLITKGNDPDDQYGFYKERIDSQNDFSYIEYNTEDNDLTDEVFEDVDVIVMLFGLYHNNQEMFEELFEKSKEFGVPVLLVRFFGMEYILKELEERSDAVVGWNPHCIVDAIETLVNGKDWVKPCDTGEKP
ncbi:MAG: nuclease [Methanobrevibacter thaueri]|uniref:Nuclease n=1 Tax=Methanobrevibacter thaueri TaxID=190975 RepID=A0A8T3V422_9EURY|nr:nuclease [Methanobrevibacter thaueri]MBE6501282.1 nuclease [Methanobrevibacter thaueri]